MKQLGIRWIGGLMGAILLIGGPAQASEGSPVGPVLVVLELSAPLLPAHEHWLQSWLDGLEASEGVAGVRLEVGDALLLEREDLSAIGSSEGPLQLQRRAVREGLSHLVFGRVTRLGQSYSLDVEIYSASHRASLAHMVYEGEGPTGLKSMLGEAAVGVRNAFERVGGFVPQGRPLIFARPAFGPEAPASDGADGEASDPESVSEIRVEGNRRIDADAIRAVIGTRVGERLRHGRIAEDVRRIHELGFFRGVHVDLTGTVVTFIVEENPIIRRVSVSGNASMGAEDIKEQLTLTVGSTIDYPLLLENQARVVSLYKAKGFHLAEVDYEIEALGQDAVAVNFRVIEGRKLRLTALEFTGNDALDADTLRSVMQTKPWGWTSRVSHFWDRSGIYAEPIFFQDLDRVQRRYMDEGFIRVRVGEPEVETDDDGLRVTVAITEGPRYTVGDVDVSGDESMDREELLSQIELVPGEVFNRSTLTSDVERLRAYYSDRGFFSARVVPRTRVDDERHEVACLLEVEKGELYFVDRIEVRGNTRTRDQVIRRELGVVEGELYSSKSLERSRARVKRLGFFEEVSMETKTLEEENLVVVDVDVVERPTGSFSFGAGFGSTDGFLINTAISQENLFGKGYGLTANVDLGTQNTNMYLRFSDPYFMGTAAGLTTTLQSSDREFLDFDQEVMGFSVNVSYPLDEGETRLGSGYSYSEREVTGIEEFQASSLLQREEFQGSTSTSMLSLSLLRDTRDDIRFPKKGNVTGVAFEFAGLGGLSQFLRIEGRTTWYLPAKRWLGFESTFVVNSRLGWTVPFNSIADFDLPDCTTFDCLFVNSSDNGQLDALTGIDTDLELPLTERYFLGGLGAFQLRGFKQRSVGPRRTILDRLDIGTGEMLFFPSNRNIAQGVPDRCLSGGPDSCNDLNDKDIDDFEDLDLTDVIGGNKMFLLNFELQIPISEELGLTAILFFDMGNAFSENESINPADFRFGTGAGVQWFSPFGPILVQLGIPLDPLEDEDGSVFEFSLGGSQF